MNRAKREQAYNLILLIFVVYIVFSGGRFWFYLNESRTLINLQTGENYTIGGGPDKKSIFIVGDSASVAVGADDYTGSYHYQYLSKFSDTHTFDVKNFAMSGARTADLDAQFNQIDMGDRADLMFITIGGNDVTHGTSWKKVELNLRKELVRANAIAETVVLITPGDLGEVKIVPYLIRRYWAARSPFYSELARVVARDTGTIQVDIFVLSKGLFGESPEIFYAEDLFHPSTEGYKMWADAIEQFYVF
ncbi:MAG: GDSL-type esterase/lipase family protein [bacterium]|nr:GDSL-type esterase/lipase family protein [bacterium]